MNSIDELKETMLDNNSEIVQLYQKFTCNILINGSNFGADVKQASDLISMDSSELQKFADELQGEDKAHEALFIAYLGLSKSSTAEDLRKSAIGIYDATDDIVTEDIKRMATNLLQTYKTTIDRITETDDENEVKTVAIADVWTAIGYLHCVTGGNARHIVAADKAMEIMHTLPNPQRFSVYADCFENKAYAMMRMEKYGESLENYKKAKKFMSQCTDKTEDEKRDDIKWFDVWIAQLQGK